MKNITNYYVEDKSKLISNKDSYIVGKKFRNKKTKGVYIVKNIAVDTETEELRVIYCDGVSTNDWDRPMLLFIKKFEEYKEQGEQ